MGRKVDLTGKRIGRLTVVEQAGRSESGRLVWRCRCDCGNETVVLATSLATGRTKSCGCLQKERVSRTFKKHGQYGTRLYKIWSNMVQRCTNPNNTNYLYYGEKGICVCEDWLDFSAFQEWANASGYADNLSVDRIDNDKGYSPDNCRWASAQEQTDNRKCSRYISLNGKTQTLKRWSEETGIPYHRLLWRVRQGWSAERALSEKNGRE